MENFNIRIIDFVLCIIIAICFLSGAYSAGYKSAYIEPQSDFVWIDNNRLHVDSIIQCSPIYGDNNEIIGSWIKASYGDTDLYIECLNENGYEWKDFRDSWLDAFKEGVKETRG